MSGRKLGGGRILGSGKGLAPPGLPRAASPFAPSDSSTVSLPSSASPPDSQDLASHVHLGRPANGGTKLICPICDEEMVTLLQLNRHLDDAHQELPEADQDEIKTWFDKQVSKARRFQPLSLINQKLRGLDVFEPNATPTVPSVSAPSVSTPDSPPDPEELVTRKHWQRPTGGDSCTDPACRRTLGPLTGSVNCRQCGRLFCEEHTMYQMKLSRSAHHEPVRGVWCRVCETCYKSRDGYNDHAGHLRDHSDAFLAVRRERAERQNLETAKLEKRLTRLTRLLTNLEESPTDSAGGLLPLGRSQRKAAEQSVVAWEDDATVAQCPFCQQEFGSWTFRRHHCRICGRVVCADPRTSCSSEVGLDVAGEKPLPLDIRMCRDCKSTLFSKRDFAASIAHKPPDQRAYETLRQFERGIRLLLPSFQRSLLALQPADTSPTHAQIQDAAKIRRRLVDSFTKYDLAARRMRDLPTNSPTQKRLQRAVHAAASSFLHLYMLPLKSVPRILSSNHRRFLSVANGGPSPLRNGESASSGDPETASLGGASEASTAASALEIEEKEVRERLVVLEEQRFLVQDMANNARGARRFEEAGALSRNLEELDREIEGLRRQVSGVEERWEGLYGGGYIEGKK